MDVRRRGISQPLELAFLDGTIFCAYKIRFPIPGRGRAVILSLAEAHTYTRPSYQNLGEYPQIRFLSGGGINSVACESPFTGRFTYP